MPVFIFKVVDEAATDLRFVCADVGVKVALLFGGESGGSEAVELEELLSTLHGAVLGTEERIAISIEACSLVGEDGTHRMTFTSGIGGVFSHRLVENLVLI